MLGVRSGYPLFFHPHPCHAPSPSLRSCRTKGEWNEPSESRTLPSPTSVTLVPRSTSLGRWTKDRRHNARGTNGSPVGSFRVLLHFRSPTQPQRQSLVYHSILPWAVCLERAEVTMGTTLVAGAPYGPVLPLSFRSLHTPTLDRFITFTSRSRM